MKKITANKPQYPQIFGGIGFHNTEALLYPIIEKEHFNRILCKCYFFLQLKNFITKCYLLIFGEMYKKVPTVVVGTF